MRLGGFSAKNGGKVAGVDDEPAVQAEGYLAPCGAGCSQRYPHPGYAQNYVFWLAEASPAPVDINGDRGGQGPTFGQVRGDPPDSFVNAMALAFGHACGFSTACGR